MAAQETNRLSLCRVMDAKSELDRASFLKTNRPSQSLFPVELSPLEAGRPELREALCDRRLMGVWELVRQHKAVATVATLRNCCDLDDSELQQALDRLVALKLLQPVAARGRRRAPGWRVARERLVVAMDLSDLALERELRNASLRIARTHFEEIVEAHGHADSNPNETWRFASSGTCFMTVEDLREFARRVRAVTEFVTLVSQRRTHKSTAGTLDAPAPNHAILIRIEPLHGRLLPTPDISFEPADRAKAHHAKMAVDLSPRERQVADALVGGLSRPKIAAHLGISSNTASTLAKRVYRKLGVRSRFELMSRMNGSRSGPSTDD